MSITAQDLVRRELHYCISSLVHTLAKHGCSLDLPYGDDLAVLTEQAAELAAPVLDYEEAAREAGWQADEAGKIFKKYGLGPRFGPQRFWIESWEAACEKDELEPYEREVCEHWIVSDWLAYKLEAKGEKVDRDFAGMTVWARTTTGQAIYMDHVIEQITEDLNNG